MWKLFTLLSDSWRLCDLNRIESIGLKTKMWRRKNKNPLDILDYSYQNRIFRIAMTFHIKIECHEYSMWTSSCVNFHFSTADNLNLACRFFTSVPLLPIVFLAHCQLYFLRIKVHIWGEQQVISKYPPSAKSGWISQILQRLTLDREAFLNCENKY